MSASLLLLVQFLDPWDGRLLHSFVQRFVVYGFLVCCFELFDVMSLLLLFLHATFLWTVICALSWTGSWTVSWYSSILHTWGWSCGDLHGDRCCWEDGSWEDCSYGCYCGCSCWCWINIIDRHNLYVHLWSRSCGYVEPCWVVTERFRLLSGTGGCAGWIPCCEAGATAPLSVVCYVYSWNYLYISQVAQLSLTVLCVGERLERFERVDRRESSETEFQIDEH